MIATRIALAGALALALGLSACSSAPAETPDETYAPAPTETAPSDAVTPNPIEPDTTLIVRATAIAQNGATMALELQVHQSVRFDDLANQSLADGIVQDCAGSVTAESLAAERWSLTRANLTAIPVEGSSTWPQGATIQLPPAADPLRSAARGIVSTDASTGAVPCLQDKTIASAGKGAFAFGIPGDADAATGWSALRFGFITTDVKLTDCSIEVTDLGRTRGAAAEGWSDSISGTDCTTGRSE